MGDLIRTCQRSYVDHGDRAGQVKRVHVVDDGGSLRPGRWEPGSRAMCGQVTGTGRYGQSEGILRDAPHPLPPGMSWCHNCVGKLAEQLGRTAEVAALLGLAEVAR